MGKYYCALELYCNLTPAELICHLCCCSMPGRAYLRKDNSCKNWSKGIIFTVFKRRQKAYCDKHRDMGQIINTWDDYQFNLTWENPAYISIHNLDKMQWMEKFYVRPTEPTQNNKSWKYQFNSPNSSQNIFSQRQKARFENTNFKLMATEIVKIKLYYLNIRIAWKTKPRFFCQNFRLSPTLHFDIGQVT